ncbi:hypothetical protein [Streptomyces sp. NPDC057675]|uniref:hypothetical protein n=1 Tax=Streptomyces sp. NPDC057675 TaxID=3346204 RepID=UPI0036A074C0
MTMRGMSARKAATHLALLAIAATGAVLTAAPAQAVGTPLCISGASDNGSSWSYNVCGMPDIDQRRAGLPENGANYCAPTAALNQMFYLDKHGYPNLLAGDFDPTANDPVNYNEVTAKLSRMGNLAETDPSGGTSHQHTVDGINDLIESKGYEDQLEADYIELDDEDNVSRLMVELTRGGRDVMNASVGFYDAEGDRVGGHALTVVGVRGDSGNHHSVTFHNPANDADLYTQSATASVTYALGSDNGDGPKVVGYGGGGSGTTARLEGVTVITTAP